jgi:hypothetical protein
MTASMRDRFADLRVTTFSATGAFTAETEQDGAVIDRDALLESAESLAVSVAGILTAGSPAGSGVVTVSANWQQADDSGFSSNVEDVPDHEVISALTVATSSGNRKYYAYLAANLQRFTRRYIRAQVTVGANAADTHASTAQYLISGGQKSPTSRVGAGVA